MLPAILAIGLAFAALPADAAPAVPVDVRAGSLAEAVSDLARQARVELVFDRSLLRGLIARPVRGRLTAGAAFARLLSGTGIGYRTTQDGAFVLFAIAAPRPAPPAAERGGGDGAVSELLVVGRRTQNVDIRRTQDDIQPYQVLDRRDIEDADRQTLDDFLRTREPANTQAGPLTLGGGDIRSSVNLRGFGETSTLVLVDGRRMPFVPSAFGEFNQADLNGIPPGAVERIEVLTTTAGGIYGPGAIGGVVNVVLRRDYRGADLTASGGLSDRGDAANYRLEGRLGFTPDHGATDVMLFVAHSQSQPLLTGSRDYAERAGRLLFANDPAAYAASNAFAHNGVSVASLGGDLSLDPDYGGASLGSLYTFLPAGFSGTRADAAAQLLANAGKLPLGLSDDDAGRRGYAETGTDATSGILNVRHRLGPGAELFFDGLYIRERGQALNASPQSPFQIAAGEPGNPFGQDISLSFPLGLLGDRSSYGIDINRSTAGAIVDLPHGWKASADYTVARSRVRVVQLGADLGLRLAVLSGAPGPTGEPPIRPFGDWTELLAAIPNYLQEEANTDFVLKERSSDLSLRLSGPVLTLPGGPLTATLLVEDRQDRVADSTTAFFGATVALPSRAQRVRSAYAELRAPLAPRGTDSILVRGLEVQLALRHDQSTQRGPSSLLTSDPDIERFSVRRDATTFTAGARLQPSAWLMFRASLATGEQLPTFNDLQFFAFPLPFELPDPKRAGRLLGSEQEVTLLAGGSTRVAPSRALSFTAGFVVNPDGRAGPRLSLDYSRIVISHQAVAFPLSAAELLADEAQYPDRVIRAPLAAADRTAGVTAGPVITLDTTDSNVGRTVVEAVDAKLDWLLTTDTMGDFRLYGALTWQPTFTVQSPGVTPVNSAGYSDGPIEWRGHAGVEWSRGPLSAGMNAQYYGRYRTSSANFAPESNAALIEGQGAAFIPAQLYLDLSIRWRFSAPRPVGPFRAMEARFSIQNLLDHSPPIVANSNGLGFSPYGDPRGRRGVLTLSAKY